MQYKGKELKEANGAEYPFGNTRYGVDCFECAAEIPEEPKKRWCGVEEDA